MDESFDHKTHAIHNDAADFTIAQYFDNLDNADGTGPSNVTDIALSSISRTPNSGDPRLMLCAEYESIELIEDRLKKEREQGEALRERERVKRSESILGAKNAAEYQKRFRTKDIENSRALRAAFLAEVEAKARNKRFQPTVSNRGINIGINYQSSYQRVES